MSAATSGWGDVFEPSYPLEDARQKEIERRKAIGCRCPVHYYWPSGGACGFMTNCPIHGTHASSDERVWDADASCGAEFELDYPPAGRVVAICELEPSHDGPCALSDRPRGERARAERWEWIARRLLVLGEYGFGTDLFTGHLDERDFLTDEWLSGWYGTPLEEYVIDALHEADATIGAGRHG